MKAEMNSQGVITITPESGVEAFALRRWAGSLASVLGDVGPDPDTRFEAYPARLLNIDHNWGD